MTSNSSLLVWLQEKPFITFVLGNNFTALNFPAYALFEFKIMKAHALTLNKSSYI